MHVLEQRVSVIEDLARHVGDIDTRLTLVQADMQHVLSGAGRLSSAVEKLTDAAVDQRVAIGANNVLVEHSLRELQTSVSGLSATKAALKWPPTAKATVAAAAIGAAAAILVAAPPW